MAWTTPGTAVAGAVLTAAFWNEQVRDNMNDMRTGYRYVTTVYFASSGTFSKGSYSYLRAIRVKCQGSGGGGGGTPQGAGGQGAAARNGGGGAYAESFITDIAGLASSVTVTVGAGGTGGAAGANAGGAGNTSSFGSLVSAGGGNGGNGGVATGNALTIIANTGTAGRGSTTGTGDLVVPGGSGRFNFVNSANDSYGAGGGASVLGDTRTQYNTDGGAFSVDGFAGGGYGSGGNGGLSAQNAGARPGGAGAPGIVIVELYA